MWLAALALAALIGWWMVHSNQPKPGIYRISARAPSAITRDGAFATKGGQSAPTNNRAPRTTPGDASGIQDAQAAFDQYRITVLKGHYGTNRVEDLLKALVETPGGPETQLIFQALALRKQEALPVVKDRLRTGAIWEKHMLARFLGLCPWKETKDELLALATSESGHWLPKQAAIFALGSLGDVSVGEEIVAVLNSSKATVNLQMAAISALSRIGFKDAVPAITPFTRAENIHVRLFAARALGELGEPVDKEFLLSTLHHEDYVARQEASESLWKIDGQDVADALRATAKNDFNEAVREAASQALLKREIAGRNPSEKVEILRQAMDSAGRLTALWILRTVLDEAGAEGRRFLNTMAARDDFLGERSRAYMVIMDSRSR